LISKQYKKLKKKLKQINVAVNYPDNKSKEYDKNCDERFYKFFDNIITIMWMIFIITSIVNVFYFVKYHAWQNY